MQTWECVYILRMYIIQAICISWYIYIYSFRNSRWKKRNPQYVLLLLMLCIILQIDFIGIPHLFVNKVHSDFLFCKLSQRKPFRCLSYYDRSIRIASSHPQTTKPMHQREAWLDTIWYLYVLIACWDDALIYAFGWLLLANIV